jgi:tetratricopeptide (TPR) repeat protein
VAFLKLNAEEGEGVALAEEYEVQGYPTFVLTDAEGSTIARWSGYDTPSDFVETLEGYTADPITIPERETRFVEAPSARDAGVLGDYYGSRGEHARAAELYTTALELGEPADLYELDLFYTYVRGSYDELYSVEEVVEKADVAMASPHLSEKDLLRLARVMARLDEGESETWVARPYVEAALEATEGMDDEEIAKGRRTLRIEHLIRVEGDVEEALALKRETLPEGWQEDAGELNGFAWWCFEREINVEEAEALARKGVELAAEGAEKATILDTVAELAYLRGDSEEAAALISEAIEQDPDNDYYKEQLVRFKSDSAMSSL